MPGIGYVKTGIRQPVNISYEIPTDESIGAMLFDISGFQNPFDNYPMLYNTFGNGKLVCIGSMEEARMYGIADNGFLNGMLYYHVSQFYDFVGRSQDLYIMLADCSANWEAVEQVQYLSNNKIFQIGIWTHQPIWRYENGNIGFTELLSDLQVEAEELCGKVGQSTATMVPLSIVLCANGILSGNGRFDLRKIPDGKPLNLPKISVVFAQNGTEAVHAMQSSNPSGAPVGALGHIMACLALAGAEESIGATKRYNLNKNEQFTNPELGIGDGYTPLSQINQVRGNLISLAGYIIPVQYDGLEAEVFFSSDTTMSNGDYGIISNNRIIHKCRRAAITALLPYINSHHIYDPNTRTISVSSTTQMSDSINTLLTSVLVNREGFAQVDGHTVSFDNNTNILNDDAISMQIRLKPVNYDSVIEEEVQHPIG